MVSKSQVVTFYYAMALLVSLLVDMLTDTSKAENDKDLEIVVLYQTRLISSER